VYLSIDSIKELFYFDYNLDEKSTFKRFKTGSQNQEERQEPHDNSYVDPNLDIFLEDLG